MRVRNMLDRSNTCILHRQVTMLIRGAVFALRALAQYCPVHRGRIFHSHSVISVRTLSDTHNMQIYNIIPDKEGNWKAVLVGADELVVSYASRDKLIETMSQWAEKAGDPLTLRIHAANGSLEKELVIPIEDSE